MLSRGGESYAAFSTYRLEGLDLDVSEVLVIHNEPKQAAGSYLYHFLEGRKAVILQHATDFFYRYAFKYHDDAPGLVRDFMYEGLDMEELPGRQ